MKALIPAAGLGTRYLPLTKSVPKELIPVGKFPVLHHVVAEAKAAGCDQIGIILSAGKEAIRDYFSWDADLMAFLDAKGKRDAMAEWEELMDGLTFSWIDQPEQRGLGDAILCGESFAAGDPVAVLLGDTIMEGGSPLPEMVRQWNSNNISQVAIEPIQHERATKYGVCGGAQISNNTFALDCMIEKPSVEEIPVMRGSTGSPQGDSDGQPLPSAYAFAARYLLSPEIFKFLNNATPGRNNEIQLTDAMAKLLAASGFGGVQIPGKRLDIGAPSV